MLQMIVNHFNGCETQTLLFDYLCSDVDLNKMYQDKFGMDCFQQRGQNI